MPVNGREAFCRRICKRLHSQINGDCQAVDVSAIYCNASMPVLTYIVAHSVQHIVVVLLIRTLHPLI